MTLRVYAHVMHNKPEELIGSINRVYKRRVKNRCGGNFGGLNNINGLIMRFMLKSTLHIAHIPFSYDEKCNILL